jgi:hypothetical protein
MRDITAGHKISIHSSAKCGTRTIKALTALTHDTTLYKRHPEWFVERTARGVPSWETNKPIFEVIRKHDPLFGRRKRVEAEKIQTDIRVAIVRDPVKRFLSGYRNRVLWLYDLPRMEMPSIDVFQEHFDHYMNHPEDEIHRITGHFVKQVDRVGRHPSLYTHIFKTDEMELLFQLLEKVYGREFPRFQLQQGGNDIDVDMDSVNIQWIKERYEEDYTIWFPDLL